MSLFHHLLLLYQKHIKRKSDKVKKCFLMVAILVAVINVFAQTDSFDVFIYQRPEFFSKTELPSQVQYNMSNNDSSFCTIILYKSLPAKHDVMKDVITQWNEQVVKRLSKADKKPGRILTEQLWDGWVSTLAIGNFYQNKKMCSDAIFL